MSAWIETYTGRRFPILEPKPELVDIEDIAHALSMQCRFTGHTKKFYSVAEHCWNVSLLSKPDYLWGLLHDASEAYLSDLSRPVKQLTPLGPPYLEIEDKLMRAICIRFALTPNPEGLMPVTVKRADNTMLMTEKEQLMGDLSWAEDNSSNSKSMNPVIETAIKTKLHCWTPTEAETYFLERYHFLRGEM